MKSVRQLMRQPGKTVAGILLIAFAVAILCVCAGQALSARQTEEGTDENFTTIAYRSERYYSWGYVRDDDGVRHYYFSNEPTIEAADWTDELVENYPQYVKLDFKPGLISGYLPELEAVEASGFPEAPNTCAMLEVTLESIGEVEQRFSYSRDENWNVIETPDGWALPLVGRVESVIGLHDDWIEPVGYTIELNLVFPDKASAEALVFEAGERYLVYGMDYYDMCYDVLEHINEDLSENTGDIIKLTELDFEALTYRTEQEIAKSSSVYDTYTVAYYHYGEYMVPIDNHMEPLLRSASMTLKNEADFGYGEEYDIPSIAHLDGSAEDFLKSVEGEAWRNALEGIGISNNSFPIIGLSGSSKYITSFVLDACRIVEGRDFSPEELAEGAKLCLISKPLAEANGLSLGDTISPRFYENDLDSPYQNTLELRARATNPVANMFTVTSSFAGLAEEYTIVGIYEQDYPWLDGSEHTYAFTPNTIFVPESSVDAEMEYFDDGFFRTLILYNGHVPEVRKIVDDAGYQFLFEYADQGYTQIAEGLYDYQTVAKIALTIGVVLYGMVLVLYLLLFPGRQGRQMIVMNAMGTTVAGRLWHSVKAGFGVLLPGTILGCVLARFAWDKVVGGLLDAADVELEMVLTLQNLALVAASQLILALILTALVTLALSKRFSGMKHK